MRIEEEKIQMRPPDDFHVHLRSGEILKDVLPYTSRVFRRALIMPNLRPNAILTGPEAHAYERFILDEVALDLDRETDFKPLMTIQITDRTTPATIRQAKAAGVLAGKLYPQGVTTNSQNGVADIAALRPALETMQDRDLVLSVHGQKPGVFCLDQELRFLDSLYWLVEAFPKLRIVLEHISTAEAVEAVRYLPEQVAATITAHHLVLTLDDVLVWKDSAGQVGLNPHHYCQPIPRSPADREALIEAATEGNPKFFFGSDSAPHPRRRKEASCGCAGVFSAPVVLPALVEVFRTAGPLSRLEPFVSEFGAKFYRLPLNKDTITLKRKSWRVPVRYGDIVPWKAGETLDWQVV